jgi:hypothetical protein
MRNAAYPPKDCPQITQMGADSTRPHIDFEFSILNFGSPPTHPKATHRSHR